MSNCPRGARFFGCKFEPRYDSEPNNDAGITNIARCSAEDLKTLLTKTTYVRDVCVYCGKTIERGQP